MKGNISGGGHLHAEGYKSTELADRREKEIITSNMDSRTPTVRFQARSLLEDECAVVRRFVDHSSHCRVCRVRESDMSFCPRGYGYAKDVRQYLYMKKNTNDENVYSEIDLQRFQQESTLHIPSEDDAIRHILRGRGRSEPRIRLRFPQLRRAVNRENPPRAPQTYGDPEYLTVLAHIPAISVPLQIPLSKLRK